MVKLQVLICTIGAEGIGRVVESSHPIVEGVEYLVSWQLPDGDMDVPEALAVRDDVKVCKVNSRGICRNRNKRELLYIYIEYCFSFSFSVYFRYCKRALTK